MARSRKKPPARKKRPARKPLVLAKRQASAPRRWHHLEDERELLDAITSNVNRLLADKKRECYAKWRALYLDRPDGDRGTSWMGLRDDRRARHNIVQNAVDAMVSDLAKDMARPMLVPVGADWKLTRKTKATQRALDGDWERIGADAMRERQVLDACVYGEGHIRVYPSFDRVAWRRVAPWCLLSEPGEDAAGRLMTRYEVSAIDIDVLIEAYATDEDGNVDVEMRAAIEDSETANGKQIGEWADAEDGLVLVMEAWRLPTRPGGEGRYIVCTSRAVLANRPWKADFFPYSSVFYSPELESTTRGVGLPERMAGQQYDQNETSEIISDNKRLIAGVKIEVANGLGIDEESFTNESGILLKHEGPPGSLNVIAHSGNPLDLVQNARADRMEMLTDQGINPMQASGQIPEQVDSGKAQQVYRDNAKARHAMPGRQCERGAPQLARCHILAWEQIVDAGMKPVGRAHGRRKGQLEPLNYNDVRLSSEQFDIRVFPVSNLSDDVSGRFAEIQQLASVGWISELEARRLMSLPDIEENNDLALAGQDLALDLIDAALDIDAEKYDAGMRVAATRVCDRQFLITRGWQMHASIQAAFVSRGPEYLDELDQDLAALRELIGSADKQLKEEAEEAAKQAAAAQAAAAAATQPPPPAAPPPQMTGPIGVVS